MTIHQKIQKILDDPSVHYWVKEAIQTLMGKDPVDAKYDAKLVADIMAEWCEYHLGKSLDDYRDKCIQSREEGVKA